MIGQEKIQEILKKQWESNSLPHFVIITGAKGSGKKTLIKELGFGNYIAPDVKVDTMRAMINDAYTLKGYTFVIPDADTMSLQAKNSILKIVEECPNRNYFIMTLEDENNTLATIRSRAAIYHMETYTPKEIDEYVRQYMPLPPVEEDEFVSLFTDLCDTPGEVQLLASMGAYDFYNYVKKVVDNVATVSGSNAFKIAEKIALKNEEDKYDLRLFWKAFNKVCIDRFRNASVEDIQLYAKGVKLTSERIRDLRITGINKQALFDVWLLGIREIWM